MKKVLMAGFAVALACTVQADILVNFIGSYGAVDNDGFSPLLGNGEQAFIQLIYAGANNAIDSTGAGVGGTLLDAGDDVVLWSGLGPVAVGGDFTTEFGTFDAGNIPGAGINGGFVYGRIFQDSGAAASSYFYQGTLSVNMPNVDLGATPPPLSTQYDLLPSSAGAIANMQVVPEPATLGLMGVAGLGMFLARRKARR